MSKHFADQVVEAVKKKGNAICVGLDPRLSKIPKKIKDKAILECEGSPFRAAAEAIIEFNKGIIDAVFELVPVVKPQIAFYEIYGHEGIRAYEETLRYARSKGLITIADAKRNDIGTTAEAYARAFLGEVSLFEAEHEVVMPVFGADSITINPYMGWDSVKPFVDECKRYDKGIFVLLKTSNKSSGDIQDLQMADGEPLYNLVSYLIDSWGADEVGKSGYSFVGAVVGATYPEQAKFLRKMMPNTIFLVPGYGAQGGRAQDVKPCFNSDGLGALVNNSRGIIFAYDEMEGFDENSYADAARAAVRKMRQDLESIM